MKLVIANSRPEALIYIRRAGLKDVKILTTEFELDLFSLSQHNVHIVYPIKRAMLNRIRVQEVRRALYR
jgi:hypothetical protein